jgi:hypothetical protein
MEKTQEKTGLNAIGLPESRFLQNNAGFAPDKAAPCLFVARSWLFREIFLEFSRFTIIFFSFWHRVFLDRDIGPELGIFGIDLNPPIHSRLGIGLDGISGAFWFADPTVNAFVRVDDEKILSFIKTVHGANFNAIRMLAHYTVIDDDISHSG